MRSHTLSISLSNRSSVLDEMAQSLTVAARHGDVDLADERLIDAVLRHAGFARADIHTLAEAAVDRARAALQAVGRIAAPTADALGLILLVSTWIVAYVGLVRA